MRWRSPPLPDLRAGSVTCYREKVDLVQTHTLTRDTLRALVAYLTIDSPPATGPLLGFFA